MSAPWRFRRGRVAGFVVGVLVASGCAPGTPAPDSWRDDARRALSDASSAVLAAEVGLRESRDDGVFDRYLQTVVVDAEGAVGAASDTISAEQPPPSERRRYDAVTTQLDDAASLVTSVRIAVVDRETGKYDALADQLEDTATGLQSLELELEHPPR